MASVSPVQLRSPSTAEAVARLGSDLPRAVQQGGLVERAIARISSAVTMDVSVRRSA